MIVLRKPEELYQIDGAVENGTFHGRWHFSFGDYDDPKYVHFGMLRVFNDDTLSPGAIWPLHPHRDNLLPLVSNRHADALRIISDAEVYASFIQKNKSVRFEVARGRGVYFPVLEGGPVEVNGVSVPAAGAALVRKEKEITLKAVTDSEVLLLDGKLV